MEVGNQSVRLADARRPLGWCVGEEKEEIVVVRNARSCQARARELLKFDQRMTFSQLCFGTVSGP